MESISSTPEEEPRPTTSAFQAVELAAKYATVSVGLLFALGLLVANYYLLSLGFSDFELFRTRYVFIGVIFVLPLLVAMLIVYLLTLLSKSSFVAAHRTGLSLTCGTMLALLIVASKYGYERQFFVALALSLALCVAFLVFDAPEILPEKWQLFHRRIAEGTPHRPAPHFLMVLGVALAYYFVIWSKFAFPQVPEQFGGAEPRYGYFFVKDENIDEARAAGMLVDSEHRESQGIRLFWKGSDYVIFQTVVNKTAALIKVSDDLFYAWVPSENTFLVSIEPLQVLATPPPGAP